MAELKTQASAASVQAHVEAMVDETRRQDCRQLMALMSRVVKAQATMWGPSIIGFGSYHYRYASGHEGDACLAGFASRKQDIAIYIVAGFDDQGDLLAKLGKFKTAKVCLYVKRLADIDTQVLEQMVKRSVRAMRERYP